MNKKDKFLILWPILPILRPTVTKGTITSGIGC